MKKSLRETLNRKGETIWVDDSSILTSNPPQFSYYQDKEGNFFGGYIKCKDCVFVDLDEVVKMKYPSEGFFLAKRQLQNMLDLKLQSYERLSDEHKNPEIIKELESVRNYVRNFMLWNNSDGK